MLKLFARKYFIPFNRLENKKLSLDFQKKLMEIKEKNSHFVWETYYIPKAIQAVLKEQNYLTTSESVTDRAKSMLLSDMANGVLDEFYRFRSDKQGQQ